MRIFQLFVWLAAVAAATAEDNPVTIEIDVVSPRNETYNSAMSLPLVIAIQNASTAFQHGYSITWMFNTWGTGYVRRTEGDPVPPEAVGNIWYESSNFTYFDDELPIQPGTYNLSLQFSMGTCRDTISTVTPGVTVLQTSVEFTVVDDGSGLDVDLTRSCPEFQETLTIVRLTGPVASTASCPVRADPEPEGVANPCRAQMSPLWSDCVMSNLTGSADTSACAQLAQMAAEEEAAEEAASGANNTTDDGSDTASEGSADSAGSTSENIGIRQYGSTVGSAVLIGLVALLCSWA